MRAILLTVLVLAALPARSQTACPTRASWPTTQWPSRVDAVAAAKAPQIAALEAYAFTLTGEDAERKGVRTDGVLIVHQGDIVYERYARGYDAQKRHLSWSVSKSFTNALVGIAAGQGKLQPSDSVCEHLAWAPQEHCGIRVQDLLEFASGLDWHETYEGQSNQASSVLAMLYGTGRRDMARFVLSHPSRDPPGQTWAYSSGDTVVLGAILEATLAPEHGAEFPWTLLFDRLGMQTATWERDGAGTLVASSYLYATPRDLARFGFFVLNDGCWAQERILPEGWIAASTQPSAPLKLERLYWEEGDVQGRQFWLNRPVPEANIATPWPDVPEDAFAARGHWGQSITIIPSLDVVIVRVGDDREGGAFDFNRFLSLAIQVAQP